MQFSRINTSRNYAWMLRANDARWNTHFAYCWVGEENQEQRHDLERLAGRMDSYLVEVTAADVADAARKEGFEHLAPIGAQTTKKLLITLFDL